MAIPLPRKPIESITEFIEILLRYTVIISQQKRLEIADGDMHPGQLPSD